MVAEVQDLSEILPEATFMVGEVQDLSEILPEPRSMMPFGESLP